MMLSLAAVLTLARDLLAALPQLSVITERKRP